MATLLSLKYFLYKPRERKIIHVVRDFDLFSIENGIVQLQSGLTAAKLNPDRDIAPRDRLAEIRQRIGNGYDNSLFPDDCRQMDEEALVNAQKAIRVHNEEQISLLTP